MRAGQPPVEFDAEALSVRIRRPGPTKIKLQIRLSYLLLTTEFRL